MRSALAAALLLACLGAAVLAEDVVVLRGGHELRGRVVLDDGERVVVEVEGGEVSLPRSTVVEIRRDVPVEDDDPADGAAAAVTAPRVRWMLLRSGARRLGVREVRSQAHDGFHERQERVVLFDEDGASGLTVHTLERSDADLHPVYYHVRERTPEGRAFMVEGAVADGRLTLTTSDGTDRTSRQVDLPADVFLPAGARAAFDRDAAEHPDRRFLVLDLREGAWGEVRFRVAPPRAPERGEATPGAALHGVERHEAGSVRTEWRDRGGRVVRVVGGDVTAERIGAAAFERLAGRGEGTRVTGEKSRDVHLYEDLLEGWRIRKPGKAWTFEEPRTRAGGALLEVRNEPLFATVDVTVDPAPPAEPSLERAAAALVRQCRAASEGFTVVSERYDGLGPDRVYHLEAVARTKDEKTHTTARVILAAGRVYRLLAACPVALEPGCRKVFAEILDSFALSD